MSSRPARTPSPDANLGPYRAIMNAIRENTEHLPSLPSGCTRVRKALSNPNTTVDEVASLISKDPALAAFLIKTGNSPIYRTLVNNPSLTQVVRLLGFATINNLVVLHGVKSLVFTQDKRLKQLSHFAWRHLALKAGLSNYIARQSNHIDPTEAMMSAVYSEMGALAILSALQQSRVVPGLINYHALCRSYEVSLGTLLLKKWQSDASYLSAMRHLGDWRFDPAENLTQTDVVNLAHYHAIALLYPQHQLPKLSTLPAYGKIPEQLSALDDRGLLQSVMAHKGDIARLANSFL